MGVHGLWNLLESTGKPINPETLEGKILAVDISIWLNQAVKGVRDREGNRVQNAHLLTLFNRVCKLLYFRIRPVFVFDGDAPLLKKQTLALRRQRKEELNRESKQTNEKLLKTFLKRHAIKAVLGDSSKDPLPSLSSIRRDEEDIYRLPALPPAEEKDASRSSVSGEEEEEAGGLGELIDSYQMYQGELYEDPNSVDINSEEFTSLPPEVKHQILKDMKEFTKRNHTLYHKPPEHSSDFSQYQLAGLLQRNRLNQRLEGVEREMEQHSAGAAPQLDGHDQNQNHSIESRRLLSEDSAHYILIKGIKKSEKAPESQPAALPWSGGPLSGARRQRVDRPQPLWRPVCEEEEEEKPGPSFAPKPSLQPTSPRSLLAIQAAMATSSEDEREELEERAGVSPRTLLAIQQALAEEEGAAGAAKSPALSPPSRAHARQPTPPPHPVGASQPNQNHFGRGRIPSDQPVYVGDSCLASGLEGEVEEVIAERGGALHSGPPDVCEGLIPRERKNESQREETVEQEEETSEQFSPVRPGARAQLPTKQTVQPVERGAQPGRPSSFLEQRRGGNITWSQLVGNEDDALKTEAGEESGSEDSFLEVSDGEEPNKETGEHPSSSVVLPGSQNKQEVLGDHLKEEELREEGSPTVARDVEDDKRDGEEEVLEEKEEEREDDKDSEEEDETEIPGSSSKPGVREWEDIDIAELEAMESSLEVEQSKLREQRQQQERMASSVTGQMCLESQELLRMFGVPYLVAPSEAEAQCAALDCSELTHGTVTDDSDVWLFGGRHVYKNFFSQNKYVEHYQFSDLQNQLGLDRSRLINLAYLLGSDYTEGVPGVGYVTGMEILNEFPGPGLEPLTQLSDWWAEAQQQQQRRLASDPRDSKVKKKLRQIKLQPGFPNPAVAQAYLHPTVDQSDASFSWGCPHLHQIKEFCQSRFGWTNKKTEETLQPVIKQLNSHQSQLRIDSFFRLEQQERQEVRSQRLRRAVTCMKRKEREGRAGEADQDKEEVEESPSKSKKRMLEGRGGGGGGGVERRRQESSERGEEGGGFLGSEVMGYAPIFSVKKNAEEDSLSAPPSQHQPPALKQGAAEGGSSCSDDDSSDGSMVAMVTARSMFEGSRRVRGGRRARSRSRGRGRSRGGRRV